MTNWWIWAIAMTILFVVSLAKRKIKWATLLFLIFVVAMVFNYSMAKNNQTSHEQSKIENAARKMDDNNSEGRKELVDFLKKSEYQESRNLAQQYLDESQQDLMKSYSPNRVIFNSTPDLKTLSWRSLDVIENEFKAIFDENNTNLIGQYKLVCLMNNLFGKNFKVYDFEGLKEWYETKEYLDIKNKAQEIHSN